MLYETLTEENRTLLNQLLPTYRLKGRDLDGARTWCVNVLQIQLGPDRRAFTDDEIRSIVQKWREAGGPTR